MAVFTRMDGMKLMRHPNVKWFAGVGISGMVRLLTRIFTQLVAFKVFRSEHEALAFLRKMIGHQKQEALQKETG